MSYTPNLLLKNVVPVSADFNGSEQVDIRITDGVIAEIGTALEGSEEEESYDAEGAYLSGGWMDMHVHLREPGFEHKETIKTGCAAAAFGGFTEIACMPNTAPAIDSRDVVEIITHSSANLPVAFHPIGCGSQERKGICIAGKV